jgi:hypothetical protein
VQDRGLEIWRKVIDEGDEVVETEEKAKKVK